MEENKKPKRRRIGESQEMNGESGHFEKVTYNPKASFVPTDSAQGAPVEGGSDAAPRQDYPRPNYNNQNSYNYGNSRQGGYNNNRQGGYNKKRKNKKKKKKKMIEKKKKKKKKKKK